MLCFLLSLAVNNLVPSQNEKEQFMLQTYHSDLFIINIECTFTFELFRNDTFRPKVPTTLDLVVISATKALVPVVTKRSLRKLC
jgi:hypothetical protein